MLYPQLAKQLVQQFPWHYGRSAVDGSTGNPHPVSAPVVPYLPNPLA
jgi:hypothetical protein